MNIFRALRVGMAQEKAMARVIKLKTMLPNLAGGNEGLKSVITQENFTIAMGLLDQLLEVVDKHDWPMPDFSLLRGRTEMHLTFKRLPATASHAPAAPTDGKVS